MVLDLYVVFGRTISSTFLDRNELLFSAHCLRTGRWNRVITKMAIYLFLNINQLDALNFIISLFHASTCFEHMCSSSGGQKLYFTVSGIITLKQVNSLKLLKSLWWYQRLYNTILPSWRWAHVLETCRGLK